LASIDDLPIFRPRFGKRAGRGARAGPRTFRNDLLARIALRGWGGRRRSAGALRAEAHRPDARRVVIKARVVRLTAYGAKAAALHLRYIERDGVEKDGSKGELYGPDGPVRRKTFEEPRPREKHQFRFIVSPEDAGELDLTAYVRRLMTRVEQDLGRKVEWAAVNHHDTGHPHAHIVVRGVDRGGQELRLERSYIASGMRWRAQEIATQELGPRHEFEVRRTHAREVTQERFTSLDREIERLATERGRVDVRTPKRRTRVDPSILLSRLEHLEVMGLAERLSPSAWSLQEGWQKELRGLGTRGDIIKQIHDVVRGDVSHYRIVHAGEPLLAGAREGQERLVGRVAGKGLSDEVKGTFYAVIEAPNGFAYHVPLDARTAEAVAPGDLVFFGTRAELAVRPTDRRLLEKLESRPRAEPRERLWLEKVQLPLDKTPGHRGPVWLDKLDEASLAPWGFGAEVAQALSKRRDALRAFGIAPDDPRRDGKLREMERRAIGEAVAARTRQEFLAKTPERFRGKVREGPEGVPYAVVTDGLQFILVPASRQLRALAGKAVDVGRDAQGRLSIRAIDRDLGR
jgi:type IV secretory pathway VirD2 relaxase